MSQYELRIGDSEREAAVAALGEHFVAGRLTKDEYDDRSAVAWKARTNSDLAPLFVDLPSLQHTRGLPATSAPAPAPSRSRQTAPAPRRPRRVPLLPLLLVLVGLAMLTGDVWVVLLVAGVLWWTGFLGWLRRPASRWDGRPRGRC